MTQQELANRLIPKFGQVKFDSRNGVRIRCPTCDSRKAAEMKRYVYADRFNSFCYICNVKIPTAELIGESAGTYTQNVEVQKIEHAQSRTYPFTVAPLLNELPSNHPAIEFLKKDHLHDIDLYSTIYQIRYIPINGAVPIQFTSSSLSSADSIFFPVLFNGEYVGWQLRYLPGTWNGDRMISRKMKYIHVFSKGNYLYNYDNACQYSSVVLVEGIKKALKIGNAVASWGKNLTSTQIQLLQRWKYITILLDGDDKTQEAATKLCQILNASFCNCRNVDLREHGFGSPDEMTTDQVMSVVNGVWNQ